MDPDTPSKDSPPAFLANDPFPSSGFRDARSTSGAVSATDGGSEYGDNSIIGPGLLGLSGPPGEAGLPPSRPSTAGMTNASTPRPPPSRRGLAAFAAARTNSLRSTDAASRPTSSTGRTYVPSVTAQGFQKPMNPAVLQTQRGVRSSGRPSSNLGQAYIAEDEPHPKERDEDRPRRFSDASVHTLRDRPESPLENEPERAAKNENPKPRSMASNNSHVPLKKKSAGPLTVGTNGITRVQTPKSPKSPRSFRSSLGLGSKRNSKQDHERRPSPAQHKKLPSEPSSPSNEKGIAKAASKSRTGKNYEYFAGNLVFIAEGRFLNTRARPLNIVTFFLTALPSALFFGCSAPWLWHHVSPALPIIFAYVCFIAISSFLHAALSDPGVLPRNIHPHPAEPEDADPLTIGPPTTEWVMVRTFPSKRAPKTPTPDSVEAARSMATAMEVPTKYCKSCNIWRPPRAHHCRVCDACIETQDHHCVWINNCVGRRNYRYFFGYVSSATILAILLLAFSATHISSYASVNGISFGAALSGRGQERTAFAMMLYALLAAPYPASLFGYHIFLTSRGETTREYLNSHKFMPKDRHRPFSQSTWWQNLLAVLVRARTPTYMQFKSRYQPGDVRLGNTVSKKDRRRDLKERYTTAPEKHEMKEFGAHPPSTATSQMTRGGAGISNPMNSTPRL